MLARKPLGSVSMMGPEDSRGGASQLASTSNAPIPANRFKDIFCPLLWGRGSLGASSTISIETRPHTHAPPCR